MKEKKIQLNLLKKILTRIPCYFLLPIRFIFLQTRNLLYFIRMSQFRKFFKSNYILIIDVTMNMKLLVVVATNSSVFGTVFIHCGIQQIEGVKGQIRLPTTTTTPFNPHSHPNTNYGRIFLKCLHKPYKTSNDTNTKRQQYFNVFEMVTKQYQAKQKQNRIRRVMNE